MKDQNSTKKAKKAQRKEVKKEVSKSLKDAITKHKKDQHQKKFAKPNGAKGGAKGAGNGSKFNKFNKSDSKPASTSDKPKSILKKDDNGGAKRKFEKSANSSENSEKKPFKKPTGKPFVKKTDDKASVAESSGKTFTKFKKATPDSYIDRKSFKPNFKLVEDLKTGWNKVRDRSTTDEARNTLLKRMVEQMSTHVLQVTLRHDASRIVQTILQFGNQAQKDLMLGELAVKAYEISKTPYGHFTILKAITYCTRAADQRKIAAAFKGHFVSLGTNVIGSRTVESIMQLYPASITRALRAEFYGQKFCILLPEPPKSLRALLEALPAKASAIMDHMRDLVQKLVNKSLLEFTYVHHLIWEYAQEAAASATRMEDLVGQLAEAAPKLLSTKPGAKVMCTVVTHAAAKDRKRILKTLKGHVLESLCHDSAFLGIMRLADVTDDTVNVQKSLFDELRNVVPEIKYTATGEVIGTPEPPLLAIAKHRTGHKLLLRLLSPHKRHLEPDEEALFSQEVATSKKAPEMRRKEHLTFLKGPLVAVCAKHAEELVRSRAGSRVLEEVISVLHPRAVIDAVARVYAGLEAAAGGEGEEQYFEGEGYGDEEEEEEQEEEYYEEEEEEEKEEEGADEEDGEEGEEEDEDVEEDERELAEDLQEALQAGKKEAKKKAEAPAAELLAIEEDATAHALLKKLLQFEAALERRAGTTSALLSSGDAKASAKAKKQREAAVEELQALLSEESAKHKQAAEASEESVAAAVDESLWQDAYSAESGLAAQLLGHLQETGRLEAWLACNRPCFALIKLLQVPSVLQSAVAALKTHAEVVQSSAAKHEGGRLLSAISVAAAKL